MRERGSSGRYSPDQPGPFVRLTDSERRSLRFPSEQAKDVRLVGGADGDPFVAPALQSGRRGALIVALVIGIAGVLLLFHALLDMLYSGAGLR